jgi:hypothetical protein
MPKAFGSMVFNSKKKNGDINIIINIKYAMSCAQDGTQSSF